MAHIVHWMGLRTLRIRLYNAMSMRSVALQKHILLFVGPLPRVRPRNGILALVLVLLSLRSEFMGEL